MMKLTEEIFETQDFINQFFNSTRTQIETKIEDFVEKKLKSEDKSNDFNERQAKEELDKKKITQEEFDNRKREYLEYEDMLESKIDEVYADMLSNFPAMSFLKYAEEKITSNSESDDNLAQPDLLRFNSELDGEIELNDYFIRDDTEKGRDYLAGNEIQKRIKVYLFDKYPKLDRLTNKGMFIRDLISILRNLARENSPTSLALKPKATMEYLDKSKEARLKQIFSYFRLNNKKLNVDTFFQLKNPSFSTLRMEGRFNEEKLADAKDLLTRSYAGKQAEQVKPLLQRIDKKLTGVDFGEVEDLKLGLDTDKFVGTLDLKKVSRRNSIYAYWRKTNMDFKTVKISIKNFQEQLRDVIENSEDMNKDIEILANDIINFDIEYGGDKDALNYIVKVGAKSIKRLDKNDRYVKAFENLGKFTKQSAREKEGLSDKTRMESSRDVAQQTFRDKNSNQTKTDRKAGDYGLRADAAPEGGQSEFDEDLESDKARQLAAKYSDKGDFAGLMQEITFDDATGRGMTGLVDGLDTFGRESSELVNVDVDPLFGYAFLTDKDVFKNLALFENELEKLTRKLQTLSNMGKTVNLEVDYDDSINDYLEELQELVISDKKEFYLPISPELNRLVDSVNYEKMSAKVEYIQEFLELISKIIEFGEKSEQSSAGGSAKGGSGKGSGASYDARDLSRKNTRDLFKEIGEAKDAFDEMLDNILSYYITPTETSYRPFNSRIQITNTRLNAILSKAKSQEEPYFHLLSLYITGVENLFPSGNFKALESITDLLKFLTTASRFTDKEKLEERLKGLRMELRNIYDYSFDDIIEEELNAYYYGTLKRTLNRNQLDNLKLFGKNSKEVYNKVSSNIDIYPLHALIQIVRDNQKNLEDKIEELKDKGSEGFDSDTLKDFIKQMNIFSETIIKSDTEINLLEAHDNIRKMLNKPVYYKYGNIEDFTNVSTTIDILKSTFNVDVTALDIENIVQETDSMKNLGLKYGIPSEGVYFIKGNFR